MKLRERDGTEGGGRKKLNDKTRKRSLKIFNEIIIKAIWVWVVLLDLAELSLQLQGGLMLQGNFLHALACFFGKKVSAVKRNQDLLLEPASDKEKLPRVLLISYSAKKPFSPPLYCALFCARLWDVVKNVRKKMKQWRLRSSSLWLWDGIWMAWTQLRKIPLNFHSSFIASFQVSLDQPA